MAHSNAARRFLVVTGDALTGLGLRAALLRAWPEAEVVERAPERAGAPEPADAVFFVESVAGPDVATWIGARADGAPVVVVNRTPTLRGAVRAIKAGGHDYLDFDEVAPARLLEVLPALAEDLSHTDPDLDAIVSDATQVLVLPTAAPKVAAPTAVAPASPSVAAIGAVGMGPGAAAAPAGAPAATPIPMPGLESFGGAPASDPNSPPEAVSPVTGDEPAPAVDAPGAPPTLPDPTEVGGSRAPAAAETPGTDRAHAATQQLGPGGAAGADPTPFEGTQPLGPAGASATSAYAATQPLGPEAGASASSAHAATQPLGTNAGASASSAYAATQPLGTNADASASSAYAATQPLGTDAGASASSAYAATQPLRPAATDASAADDYAATQVLQRPPGMLGANAPASLAQALAPEPDDEVTVDARQQLSATALAGFARQAAAPRPTANALDEQEDATVFVGAADASPAAAHGVLHLPGRAPLEVPGYEVGRRLGEGAAATVFLVRRLRDQRDVVFKVLNTADGDDDPAHYQRFMREYDVLREIRHPNVVRIFTRVLADDYTCLVMEYCQGGDLKARLASGGLDPMVALRHLRDISCGLAAGHARGIVHRDIKPGNILFRADGSLAVADFGAASNSSGGDQRLTQAGAVVGTPYYLAPEVLRGEGASTRSDIYSLGVLLYEMLTGERPFVAKGLRALIEQHMGAPVPALPPPGNGLQPLLERLMAKDPAARPSSAATLYQAIRSKIG